jgi:hypothetical protein
MMNVDFFSNYLKIEIPEFEDRNSNEKIGYFKIYGIEKERPLIRINNYFYQGRWVKKKNFVIFTRKKIEFLKLISNSNSSLFKEKKKFKIKLIKLKKNFKKNNTDSKNFFSSKKLRLYKIPLVIK